MSWEGNDPSQQVASDGFTEVLGWDEKLPVAFDVSVVDDVENTDAGCLTILCEGDSRLATVCHDCADTGRTDLLKLCDVVLRRTNSTCRVACHTIECHLIRVDQGVGELSGRTLGAVVSHLG